MKQPSALVFAMAVLFDALSVGTCAILRVRTVETTLLGHWCAALNSALKGVAIGCPDGRRVYGTEQVLSRMRGRDRHEDEMARRSRLVTGTAADLSSASNGR